MKIKTELFFEAPSDLSVGRVHITNHTGEVANWVATPDNRSFVTKNARPGFYVAEISPPGIAPQSIIFEVKKGVANNVSVPLFSALSVTGGGTTFLEVDDKELAIQELYKIKKESPQATSDMILSEASLSPVPAMAQKKRLSVGLSQEVGGKRESWQPFQGRSSLEFVGGQINLEVKRQPEWSPLSGERVRLSLAIEDVRVERLLLPMYRGGTTIELIPSALSSSDVELRVIPSDPKLRALLRSLQAGTSDDAKAVRDFVLEGHNLEAMFGKDTGDPWGAILSALLFIRFPDVFGEFPSALTHQLIELAPWAFDSHVISARQTLYAFGSSQEDQVSAAKTALNSLAMALVRGSPYYSYANHLFCEMIEALCIFDGFPPDASKKALKIRQRWKREHTLQRGAGASFSWLRRDQMMLKNGMLAPDRRTTGLLRGRHTSIVAIGKIESGQFRLDSSTSDVPKSDEKSRQESLSVQMSTTTDASPEPSPETSPAMSRPAGPLSDPNKGRFGGKDTCGGFTLNARFSPTKSKKWVVITLIVDAANSVQLSHGDTVWFCLHPTFEPQWIKVMFRGRHATLSLQAWGGFTVGAWLPAHNVELECDLAELTDAPQIIREL